MAKNSSKPDYSRQINSLRRNTRYDPSSKRKKTKTFNEIMGRTPEDEIFGLYKIDPKTNQLLPMKIPTDGDKVVIESGPCPKEFEDNIITETLAFVGNTERKIWEPHFKKFFVGQNVFFSTSEYQYYFQIRTTADRRYGEFVLITKVPVSSSPGARARTYKTSSI